LNERFDARFGSASLAAAELADAMQHFAAFTLPALYEAEADSAPAPEPRRSFLPGWLAPQPRPSY
jgi:hypothetical protein